MKTGIVISNEKSLRAALGLMLSGAAELREAATAHEGINMLLGHQADFVLLDSPLKECDCVDTVQELLRAQPTVPVIALVPSIHSPIVDELRIAGAYVVLEKPLDRRMILDLVEISAERFILLKKIEYLQSQGHRVSGEINPACHERDGTLFYREVIRRFSKAISQVFDFRKLIELVVEGVVETFNSGRAVLLLFDARTGRFSPSAFHGYPDDIIELRTFDQTDHLPAWICKSRQILISGRASFDLQQDMDALSAEIAAGLFSNGKLVAILALGKKATGKGYNDDDLELISVLCGYLAMAIENALLYREIARSRARNENILNSLRTGIITVDEKGMITVFNKAAEEILGIKGDEVIGEKVEKAGSAIADLLLRNLSGETVFTRHEIINARDKKPLGVSTSLLRDDEGKIDGAIMAFTDLSRIKALEDKERDFERLEFWSRIAGRLAHEVKNPLVPIKTFAQLLPQRYRDKEFREEFFKVVTSEIDRLSDVITQLTRFAESATPSLKSVDIADVIEGTLSSMKQKFASKKAKVEKRYGADHLFAMADGNLLSEAFANIMDNAVGDISAGGVITITAAIRKKTGEGNGAVVVEIRDNGRGMSEEEKRVLFTPFATAREGGMGLGFAIARRIILDHSGAIEVQSEPGKGTSVRVSIPAGDR